MFHWSDNLFFGRKSDGSVRVLKLAPGITEWPNIEAPAKGDVLLDVVIPAVQWASIIASASKTGETRESYQQAVAFHG